MNAIKYNIYDILFWGVFASFFVVASHVFTAMAELVSTITAL